MFDGFYSGTAFLILIDLIFSIRSSSHTLCRRYTVHALIVRGIFWKWYKLTEIPNPVGDLSLSEEDQSLFEDDRRRIDDENRRRNTEYMSSMVDALNAFPLRKRIRDETPTEDGKGTELHLEAHFDEKKVPSENSDVEFFASQYRQKYRLDSSYRIEVPLDAVPAVASALLSPPSFPVPKELY